MCGPPAVPSETELRLKYKGTRLTMRRVVDQSVKSRRGPRSSETLGVLRSLRLEASLAHGGLPGLSNTDRRPRARCSVLSPSLRHGVVVALHSGLRHALAVEAGRLRAIASQLAYTTGTHSWWSETSPTRA